MYNLAGSLIPKLRAVCPVASLRIGRTADKRTWTFIAGPGATADQIEAAKNIIRNFDMEADQLISAAQEELDRTAGQWGGRLLEDLANMTLRGIPFPPAAVRKDEYRQSLRAVVRGESKVMPVYVPVGGK